MFDSTSATPPNATLAWKNVNGSSATRGGRVALFGVFHFLLRPAAHRKRGEDDLIQRGVDGEALDIPAGLEEVPVIPHDLDRHRPEHRVRLEHLYVRAGAGGHERSEQGALRLVTWLYKVAEPFDIELTGPLVRVVVREISPQPGAELVLRGKLHLAFRYLQAGVTIATYGGYTCSPLACDTDSFQGTHEVHLEPDSSNEVPTIPPQQVTILEMSLFEADTLARDGDPGQGRQCLRESMAWALGAAEGEESWGAALVARWREVLADYERRWELAPD